MLKPDPPSSLGNPPPPVAETLTLPDRPPVREGRVVEIAAGSAGVDLGACRKILVVKLDFIGDWILTTPLLSGLRKAAPAAEIAAIVLDRVYGLASRSTLVDRVIAVPAAAAGPIRFAADSSEDLEAFLADFRNGAFDLALVPRRDTDFNGATRIAGLSGARRVVGFSERCTARKQTDNRGFDRFLDVALLDLREGHEVEHALRMLDALGAPGDTRLHLDLRESDRQEATAFLQARFGTAPRPILAVAPFAAGRRQWPLDRTADLVGRVARRLAMDVAVIGGPENAAEARAVADAAAGDGVRAVSTAGELGLPANAALIGEAALFIGMDSGPGHIAAALGVPVVTVSWHPQGASPAHPGAPERFGPWADASRVLVLRPPVHRDPCADGCEADDPHCILGVAVDDVVGPVMGFGERVVAGTRS